MDAFIHTHGLRTACSWMEAWETTHRHVLTAPLSAGHTAGLLLPFLAAYWGRSSCKNLKNPHVLRTKGKKTWLPTPGKDKGREKKTECQFPSTSRAHLVIKPAIVPSVLGWCYSILTGKASVSLPPLRWMDLLVSSSGILLAFIGRYHGTIVNTPGSHWSTHVHFAF